MSMHDLVIARSLILASLAFARSPSAQSAPLIGQQGQGGEVQSSISIVFEGLVFESDGAPAEGAVVVSSAGGRAAVDRHGRYRLESTAPIDAQSVQITATTSGGGGGAATRRVDLSTSSGVARVDPLMLALGTRQPSWVPDFAGLPGTSGLVKALEVFDDGSGPALFVGGSFRTAGSSVVNRIAKWDGERWSALGSGIGVGYEGVTVYALTVFDDGSGPALYAGGQFINAGELAANYVAKWDGSSWAALGSGTNLSVHALAVCDDGGGPALYAGGRFTTAGGVPANGIAKWDGSTWSALGSGVTKTGSGSLGQVSALVVYDDGAGPALHAGGDFDRAGGVTANNMAKWNGSSWTPLGTGVRSFPTWLGDSVLGLVVHDDGGGPALYAGGNFNLAGSVSAQHIAKWDGSSWATVGSGLGGANALTVYDDGTGAKLYAAAGNTIRRWDGSTWSFLGSGMSHGDNSSSPVFAVAAYDDGTGSKLYAGGDFTFAGGEVASNLAKWTGSTWASLPGGQGLSRDAYSLAVFDGGAGPTIFAGGDFITAGNDTVNRIARWDRSWSPVGTGASQGHVYAITVFDDGIGPRLYAGGDFASMGGVSAAVVRWDGSDWEAVGPETGTVKALATHDDGSGPALFASAYNRVRRWNGTAWQDVGTVSSGGVCNALATHDDGSGPALYAGGFFTSVDGVPANNIAKWIGSSWSALGVGTDSEVYALAEFDDGGGPELYAGGFFARAGNLPAKNIAKWNGSSWAALGSGLNDRVFALAVFDDGGGPALYVGGTFTTAGGVAANRIAKWNGSTWTPLGSGSNSGVRALAQLDDGSGPALYVGGDFTVAGGLAAQKIAKWGFPFPVNTLQHKARRR